MGTAAVILLAAGLIPEIFIFTYYHTLLCTWRCNHLCICIHSYDRYETNCFGRAEFRNTNYRRSGNRCWYGCYTGKRISCTVPPHNYNFQENPQVVLATISAIVLNLILPKQLDPENEIKQTNI